MESLRKLTAPINAPQVEPRISNSAAIVTSLPELNVDSVRQYLSALNGPELAELLIRSLSLSKKSGDNA